MHVIPNYLLFDPDDLGWPTKVNVEMQGGPKSQSSRTSSKENINESGSNFTFVFDFLVAKIDPGHK